MVIENIFFKLFLVIFLQAVGAFFSKVFKAFVVSLRGALLLYFFREVRLIQKLLLVELELLVIVPKILVVYGKFRVQSI